MNHVLSSIRFKQETNIASDNRLLLKNVDNKLPVRQFSGTKRYLTGSNSLSYPLKMSENRTFSDVFRGYRNETLA